MATAKKLHLNKAAVQFFFFLDPRVIVALRNTND